MSSFALVLRIVFAGAVALGGGPVFFLVTAVLAFEDAAVLFALVVLFVVGSVLCVGTFAERARVTRFGGDVSISSVCLRFAGTAALGGMLASS